MSILVCGGAGYIGSHTVHELIRRKEDVIIIDNLATGHLGAIHPKAKFYKGDIRDKKMLAQIFSDNLIDTVVHFAASSLVGESVEKPLLYFANNVYGMQTLLEAMAEHKISRLVFSSTAAVYGEPESIPIKECDVTYPTNPYGESKLIMERMMKWVSKANNISYVSLRYFNAAGAMPDGSIGEDHNPETHLIPLILEVPAGKREHITIYGDDYATPDGTCLRDYIHVLDLASAHILAIDYLREGKESNIFNLGTGKGFSVREMIEAAERVTGQKIKTVIGKRRAGDPAILVAASDKAREILSWQPKYNDIEEIIRTSWMWTVKAPHGFNDK